MEHSDVIFGNKISSRDYKKAVRTQKKMMRKFGDDRNTAYHLSAADNTTIGPTLGVKNLALSEKTEVALCEKPVIIGNIRMGFGHYRISMAIASAANAMGYTPYWFDLNSFSTTTCGKIIAHQNDLYSLGSRLSQRFSLFNKLYWEPLNSEGFRKLSYNAADQKNAELMTPLFTDFPKDIPYIATHVWPAQAAVHAGLTHVVNAIPDNWPMALHLAEGSIHTVQTPSSYLGYKVLRGMQGKDVLNEMPADALFCTGHYIDHELVCNIEADCAARVARAQSGEPVRYLLTVGGAGAQKQLFAALLKKLVPLANAGKAAVWINVGDHKAVWEGLLQEIDGLQNATCHFDDFDETTAFAENALTSSNSGVHAFYHEDIFAAVYSTNLLMRAADILLTKPSELAFYPIPKLLLQRVGGHEAWGAIRSAELGDGTYECTTVPQALQMLDLFEKDRTLLPMMCEAIIKADKIGVYSGAYKVVELAVQGK